jgi:DNA-binding MarR family transcriptional regulator
MEHTQINRIAEELLAVVPQLHRMMTSEVRREGNGHASVAQSRLLAELLHGPQTMSALARHQHVSPQAVCDLIHDMLERGWLSRVPNEHDRRQQLLSVTERGQVALAEARAQALRQLTPRLHDLSETELHVLAAALPTLQRVLNQSDRPGHAEAERPARRLPDDS